MSPNGTNGCPKRGALDRGCRRGNLRHTKIKRGAAAHVVRWSEAQRAERLRLYGLGHSARRGSRPAYWPFHFSRSLVFDSYSFSVGILMTSRSYDIRPLTSISQSVVWV